MQSGGCLTSSLGHRTWFEVDNGRVKILSDLDRDTTESLARALGWFHEVVRVETGYGEQWAGPEPTILVLGDRGTFESFAPDHNFAAFFSTGRYGRSIVVDGSHYSRSTHLSLCHEYVHLILAATPGRRYPSWYHEGLARLLSRLDHVDGQIQITGSRRFFGPPSETLTMSLPELLSAGRGDAASLGIHYPAWLLVHYFLFGEGDRTRLDRYFDLWDAGVPADRAVREAFGVDIEQLELSLQLYASRGLETQVRPPSRYRAYGAIETAKLDRGSALERLSQVALEVGRGRRELEKQLLRAAVEARPESGLAHARLGWLLAVEADLTAAHGQMERALALGPDRAEVHSRVGDFWLEVHASPDMLADGPASQLPVPPIEKARQHYRRALELDPELVPALRGLGLSYVAGRDGVEPGIELLERASRVMKADTDLRLGLATLYELAGRDADAERVLLQLRRDLRPGDGRDQIDEWLEKLRHPPEVRPTRSGG